MQFCSTDCLLSTSTKGFFDGTWMARSRFSTRSWWLLVLRIIASSLAVNTFTVCICFKQPLSGNSAPQIVHCVLGNQGSILPDWYWARSHARRSLHVISIVISTSCCTLPRNRACLCCSEHVTLKWNQGTVIAAGHVAYGTRPSTHGENQLVMAHLLDMR